MATTPSLGAAAAGGLSSAALAPPALSSRPVVRSSWYAIAPGASGGLEVPEAEAGDVLEPEVTTPAERLRDIASMRMASVASRAAWSSTIDRFDVNDEANWKSRMLSVFWVSRR